MSFFKFNLNIPGMLSELIICMSPVKIWINLYSWQAVRSRLTSGGIIDFNSHVYSLSNLFVIDSTLTSHILLVSSTYCLTLTLVPQLEKWEKSSIWWVCRRQVWITSKNMHIQIKGLTGKKIKTILWK